VFSVVLIVKNEERLLPDAILSLGSVPEIVVCDTGSSDGTVEIAKNLGAKVCHFAWCEDFSAARTFAQGQASHDWIVRFDADERLVVSATAQPLTWLRDAVAAGDAEGRAMVCIRREHQPGFVHWFPRCYRRSQWDWRYPVHELLVPRCGGRLPVAAAHGAIVAHIPDFRPRPYRSILERAVAVTPTDPHVTYFFGRTCYEEGDAVSALKRLAQYLETTGGYRWHRSEAHFMRGQLLASSGQVSEALAAFDVAATISGARSEPLLEAARLAVHVGMRDLARGYMAKGRAIPIPQEVQMFGASDVPYVIDRRAYDGTAWSVVEASLGARQGPIRR
jgi:glycosyltransferase involved in cell wall biosynthesis